MSKLVSLMQQYKQYKYESARLTHTVAFTHSVLCYQPNQPIALIDMSSLEVEVLSEELAIDMLQKLLEWPFYKLAVLAQHNHPDIYHRHDDTGMIVLGIKDEAGHIATLRVTPDNQVTASSSPDGQYTFTIADDLARDTLIKLTF